MANDSYALILQETPLHPHSLLNRIEGAFERPSIIRMETRDGLRKYTNRPIYTSKYLVIFTSVSIFKSNLPHIKLDYMFPVCVCTTKSMSEEAKSLCQEKAIPVRLYINTFKREDAYDMIRDLASTEVTESFCKTLVNRVGLSPQRIVSAIMVCEQVGYVESNISKYIDKYNFIDIYDVIESLLGICRSQAQKKRAALYVHMNRQWYWTYTRKSLLAELDLIIELYYQFLDGKVTSFTVQEYSDSNNISRYRVLYVRDLMEHISIDRLMMLRQFIANSNVLEVSMHLQ